MFAYSCFTLQFVVFKPLSYCFEETIGFDVKASFSRLPVSCQIKPGDITKELKKKESLAQVFSCEFCEISNTFFYRTHPVAASVRYNSESKYWVVNNIRKHLALFFMSIVFLWASLSMLMVFLISVFYYACNVLEIV